MVLEKVECLISFSLWRNLSLEILSRKLRNDDQASSMWQQQKSKQTAAHATTPMPHPIFLAKSQVYSNSLFKSHAFSLLYISFIVSGRTFCVFLWPRPFFEKKIGPSHPAFFFTNNWISIFFWIQDATCLNTIRDLEKLSTCASQFVICWPFQTSPQSLHFL